ncbi:MAG: NfeD family protein, partial [Planctomycetota bacterium]
MIALSLSSTLAIIVGLVLLAMLLFLAEMLTPSFGLLSVIGAGALAGAVYFAWGIHQAFGIVMIIASILAVPGYFVVLVRLLPRTTAGRKLFLHRSGDSAGTASTEIAENQDLVGKTGRAESTLRPSGAVRIDGRRLIAVAESGMIARGATVKVIRLSGSNVVVR